MNEPFQEVQMEPVSGGMRFEHRNGHARIVTMTTRQGVYFRTPQSSGLGHRYQRWEQWKSWQRNAEPVHAGGAGLPESAHDSKPGFPQSHAGTSLPLAVVISQLRTALARIGHPDVLTERDVTALASAAALPLVAVAQGRAEVQTGQGRVLFDAHQATLPDGTGIQIGATQSQHSIDAQSVIEGVLRTTPIRVALSGGKDSSVVAALVLNAARRLAQAGERIAPIHVTSANTMVEAPEVMAQVAAIHDSIRAAADALGIELHIHVTIPNLMERWWVRILSGRKLPSYVGSQADCTTDMKVKPQERLAATLKKELIAAGWPSPVTLTGMRFDESGRRQAKMTARGDSATEIVDGMLAPIAHWSDAQVFDFLGDASERKFVHDWAGLLQFYADATTECVLAPDRESSVSAARCGTRSGCFVCQQVADDHSAAALAAQPGYEHLGPLVQLNRYLRSIRWDYARRHWLGRNIDPLTGHVAIHPNCFSFAECDRLLRMVLTIDIEEQERAKAVADQIAAGTLADTGRNRRMAVPQFRNIAPEDLLLIDYLRSVDGFGPEHSALLAFDDVAGGARFPVPTIAPVPRQPLPDPQFVPLDIVALRAIDAGLRDVEGMFAEVDHPYVDDAVTGHATLRHPNESIAATYELDAEAVDLFYGFEFSERVAEARRSILPACSAARYYLRLGTVRIPLGNSVKVDAQFRRTVSKQHAGLTWNADIRGLSSIDQDAHDALRHAAATAVLGTRPLDRTHVQRQETNRAVAAATAIPHSIDPLQLVAKREAIAIAVAAGVSWFDGRDLAREIRRIDAHLRAYKRKQGALPADRVQSAIEAVRDAASTLQRGGSPATPYPVELWLAVDHHADHRRHRSEPVQIAFDFR